MFASVSLGGGRFGFAEIESPGEAIKKTDAKVSFSKVANSGLPLYVRLNSRPSKSTLRLLERYFLATGTLSNVYLYGVNQMTDKWAYVRPCVGPTLAGVDTMLQWWLDSKVLAGVSDVKHPAVFAQGFLESNGGNKQALDRVVSEVGDIRYALSQSSEGSVSASEIVNNLGVVRGTPDFCGRLSKPLRRSVLNYCKSVEEQAEFDPATFTDSLVLATFGLPKAAQPDGTFVGIVTKCYTHPMLGMAAASVAALKLLVTTWAEREFHADLFDETVFYDCPEGDGLAQLLKFRQFCNGE